MRNPLFFLIDMREALTRMTQITRGIPSSVFTQDQIMISAVRDQIMILGEAAKHIPPEICDEYPDIPQNQLAKTRDRLIHGYFKTDPTLLYMMASTRAAVLIPEFDRIIADIQERYSE